MPLIPRHSGAAKQFVVSIGSLDEPALSVHAQYRPKELEVTQPVPWAKHPTAKGPLQFEFSGTASKETSMELFLDESEVPDGTLATRIAALTQLATVRSTDPKETRPEMRRPHHCVLVFGEVYGTKPFQCVIESVATKYAMFSPDGRPIRATVTLKLKEARFGAKEVEGWAAGRADRDEVARARESKLQQDRDRAIEAEHDKVMARERLLTEAKQRDAEERKKAAAQRDADFEQRTGEDRSMRRQREGEAAYEREQLAQDLE
jgi:hypothetical protein